MAEKQVYVYNLSCLQRLIHIFIFIYGPLKHESACNLIKIFEWSNPFTDQVLNMSSCMATEVSVPALAMVEAL